MRLSFHSQFYLNKRKTYDSHIAFENEKTIFIFDYKYTIQFDYCLLLFDKHLIDENIQNPSFGC